MNSILPFDELNSFTLRLRSMFPDGTLPNKREDPEAYEDILDEMFDLFLLAYATGSSVTNMNLDFDWTPTEDDAIDVVDKEIAGKTWRKRTEEYFENGGTVDDLIRIAETETHRDANEAALVTAKKAGKKFKTWQTMMDDKVRDLHEPLEGISIPINDDFYTWDGDHGQAPGMFGSAENNVNCRCELIFS